MPPGAKPGSKAMSNPFIVAGAWINHRAFVTGR